jgi:membrane protein YdbS with pleckstrin-like domain
MLPSSTHSARFNTLIRPYLVLNGAFVLAITIVGIPLALLWLLGIGQWWARHYFDNLMCEVDARELRFRKGIIFTVEKTIPLENIQDVTFIEGPVLRQFNLSVLKFETAGQSEGQAHDMQLVGIIDALKFRDLILQRRAEARSQARGQPAAVAATFKVENGEQLALLRSIDARLKQIVDRLDKPHV